MSHDVLSQLKVLMNSESHAGGGQTHHFLLEEDSAIPFSTEELGCIYDGKNLLDTLDLGSAEALGSLLLGDDRQDARLEYLTKPLNANPNNVSPIKMQNL